MIEKINVLKNGSQNNKVQALCEQALSTISSGIYNNIPAESKIELEKAVIENLFKSLSSVNDTMVQEWLKNSQRNWAVQNLGIRTTVNQLMESEGISNDALKNVLESYKDALSNTPEVMLYENYISSLQAFNYFPEVGDAVKAIIENVGQYQADVSITKLLEMMKNSRSQYLVPLIQDLVDNYLNDKNQQTKSFLKEGLIKFSYDPFVKDLINMVSVDATNLQLEYANAKCDIEKVYSPILYLGENEAVFGVRGSYYIKKGNTVSRLNKASIQKLDPEFTALCEEINNNDIIIDGKSITIYEGSDKAMVTADTVVMNGQELTSESFKSSAEVAHWTGQGRFLGLVEMFRANFNEIAEVDFAKRVFLKENFGYAADIFRLRNNVSIATYNPSMGEGTFYRNINPIQAKNLMMEHLSFDVTSAFKDILPNEKKINEEITETKKSYSDYIKILETKIEEFNHIPFAKETNDDVIEALSEELSEIKTEYHDYLNLVEGFMKAPKEDLNEATVSLEINGPLTIEVGGQKYSVPIPQDAEGGESNPEGTEVNPEDEFGSEVGAEGVQGTEGDLEGPASAVTFDEPGSELLGDSPSLDGDEVNLGSAEAEAEADAIEAEPGEDVPGEGEEEAEGAESEGDLDIEGSGEEGLDLDGDLEDKEEGDDEGEIKIDDEDEDEKKEKVDDSTSNNTPPEDANKPKKLQRKVFLKRKKIQ